MVICLEFQRTYLETDHYKFHFKHKLKNKNDNEVMVKQLTV